MTYQQAKRDSFAEPVVVVVTSKMCGPCKSMKPIAERLSRMLRFPLFLLDAAENGAMVRDLGLRTVPTMLVLKGGEVVDTVAGAQTEKKMLDTLHRNAVTQNILDLENDAA